MTSAYVNGFRGKKRAYGAMLLGVMLSLSLSACSGRAKESFITIEQLIACIGIGKTDNGMVTIEISGPFIVTTDGFNSNIAADVKKDGSLLLYISSKLDTKITLIKPKGKAEDEFRIHLSPDELSIFSQDPTNPILQYDISMVISGFMIPLADVQKSKVKYKKPYPPEVGNRPR